MSSTESQQNDPDLAGDLVLILGTVNDETRIRVSSKVMSLASPVMAAMLSPKFAEGDKLLSNSSGQPVSIGLPDDDAEAMTWICHAFHLNKTYNDEVPFSLVEKIAALCDKYDSSRALSLWGDLWQQKWQGSKDGEASYPQLLWMSYAFGHHQAFWRISRKMFLEYDAVEVDRFRTDFTRGGLPDRVFDAIESARQDNFQCLLATVEKLFKLHIPGQCPKATHHKSRNESCERLSRIGHYFNELSRLGLWPQPTSKFQQSIVENVSKLLSYENYYSDDPSYKPYSSCSDQGADMKDLLAKVPEAFLGFQSGLCLHCVKNGRVTEEEGNCRRAKCTG